jgi:hypothetical protein
VKVVLMADTSDEGIVESTGKNLTRTPTRLSMMLVIF